MYEFLNEHIYQHLDMEYIPQSKRDEYKMHSEFQDKTDKIGHPQRVIKHLTEKDYDALHEHNDYDMRLYKLAKLIQKADSRFYSLFNVSV
eukprot:974382_1